MTSLLERYERIARYYDVLDYPFEVRRYRPIRPLLFAKLSGRVLDAGIGTGRNIPFYPPPAEMIGIDQSPAMLRHVEERRDMLGAKVDLRLMDVTHLAFPDGFFDAAVASFLFCVLPADLQVAALRELGRVVKPGGPIRVLEYVRPSGALRRLSAAIWTPWMTWAYGAGFDRRTEMHVPEAGLEVASSRFVFSDAIKLIEARRPT